VYTTIALEERDERREGRLCGSGSSHAYRCRRAWIFHTLLRFWKPFAPQVRHLARKHDAEKSL